MQTSITKFFAVKPAPLGGRQLAAAAGGNTTEQSSAPANQKSPSKKHTDAESSKKTPNKRIMESEDSDDDEVVKRRPVPPSPTATKPPPKPVSVKGDCQEKSEPATPSKQPKQSTSSQAKVTSTTPLVDLSIVIRKTIARGAHALHENIGHSWFRVLQQEFNKPYFLKLSEFVLQQRQSKTVFPPEDKVYSWTHHHAIRETRVIILGQDPYHGYNQAHGLCFSVQKGVRTPPSLVNIFKELEADISGFKSPSHGDLTGWAKQGVLLLNTCLTVNKSEAYSHQSKGWETFTDAVITWISKNIPHKVVFLLWGRPAQRKSNLIDKRHKLLTAAHPSPLSAHNGFMGCRHFSQTNAFLKSQGLDEIDWKAL